MHVIIEDALATEHAESWKKRLNGAGAPRASVWRIEEAIDYPQIAARAIMQVADTRYGAVHLMGSGIQVSHRHAWPETAPLELAAHTARMFGEAGCSGAEITTLPV